MVQVGCTINYARTALWKETEEFQGAPFAQNFLWGQPPPAVRRSQIGRFDAAHGKFFKCGNSLSSSHPFYFQSPPLRPPCPFPPPTEA